jgi:hypothetical protein
MGCRRLFYDSAARWLDEGTEMFLAVPDAYERYPAMN